MLFSPTPFCETGGFYPPPIEIQPQLISEAIGQRSILKRGVSKECQQAIPTGARGGVGEKEFAHQVGITLQQPRKNAYSKGPEDS